MGIVGIAAVVAAGACGGGDAGGGQLGKDGCLFSNEQLVLALGAELGYSADDPRLENIKLQSPVSTDDGPVKGCRHAGHYETRHGPITFTVIAGVSVDPARSAATFAERLPKASSIGPLESQVDMFEQAGVEAMAGMGEAIAKMPDGTFLHVTFLPSSNTDGNIPALFLLGAAVEARTN